MKKIIFITSLLFVAVFVFAQKPGIYKQKVFKTSETTGEAIAYNVYQLVNAEGKILQIEPYTDEKLGERLRFFLKPNKSGVNERDVVEYYENTNKLPSEVKDIVDCLTNDYTDSEKPLQGVWSCEVEGIKCYRVFTPARTLLLFTYNDSVGNLSIANGILEAVNYGKNMFVTESRTSYQISKLNNDQLDINYSTKGKLMHEKWKRDKLPVYLKQ